MIKMQRDKGSVKELTVFALSELLDEYVRKALLGRARRTKEETVKVFDAKIEAIVKQYGFRPQSGHEADAAAIICAYESLLNRCEGQSLQTASPHNGPTLKGMSNDKIAREQFNCKDM